MRIKHVTGLAGGIAGLAWYLWGWQPVPDVACARLTDPAPGEDRLLNVLSPLDLRRDTEGLSAIHPRSGGTPGEARAREWVFERFREAGLKRVRKVAVVYPRWVGGRTRLALLESSRIDLPCIALNGSAATPPEGIKAPVVDVGNGQRLDYSQLQGAQTRGCIHLAWGGSLHRRDICLNAGKAGAMGVIIAHPDPLPVGPALSASHLVEAGTATVMGRLPALAVSHPVGQSLRDAASRGAEVLLSVERRYTVGRSCNIVGELGGQAREYVSLVAHYDAWHEGAADNAAGVAALLSIARAYRNLQDCGMRSRRTLRLVSTACEEEGLMGALSDVVLRGPWVKARCRGVISLDVVGAPGETLWATGWPPQFCAAAVAIGRGLGYEAATGSALGIYEGRVYGDHWPYTLLKIPGVMLAKYPYRFYHTSYDTAERLDYRDVRFHAAIAGILAWRLAFLGTRVH